MIFEFSDKINKFLKIILKNAQMQNKRVFFVGGNKHEFLRQGAKIFHAPIRQMRVVDKHERNGAFWGKRLAVCAYFPGAGQRRNHGLCKWR